MRTLVVVAAILLALIPTALAAPPAGFVTKTMHGVHFVYRPRHGAEVRRLARATPAIVRRLRADLGLRSMSPIEVVIAQNPADLVALSPRDPPPPPGAIGVAYPSRHLAVVSLSAGAQTLPISLEALYTHELSHLALDEAVAGRPVPRWFAEGIAIRHSGELSWERLESLWGATIAGRLIPIEDLARGFPREEHGSSLAYAEAGDFVRFLGDEDRSSALAELCGRLRSGLSFEEALEANFGSSHWELERQFFAGLRKRFSVVPALTGVGAVWSLVAALLLIAWRRKQRHARAVLARWAIEERVADEQEALRVAPALPERVAPPEAPLMRPIEEETGVKQIFYEGDYHTLH